MRKVKDSIITDQDPRNNLQTMLRSFSFYISLISPLLFNHVVQQSVILQIIRQCRL